VHGEWVCRGDDGQISQEQKKERQKERDEEDKELADWLIEKDRRIIIIISYEAGDAKWGLMYA
jgi:hypothetical protein